MEVVAPSVLYHSISIGQAHTWMTGLPLTAANMLAMTLAMVPKL